VERLEGAECEEVVLKRGKRVEEKVRSSWENENLEARRTWEVASAE
jgi:hypothetical protein